MIRVTRLGATVPFALNAELIETVESTPDTLITLTTGHRIVVQESLEQVIRLVIEYRREMAVPWGVGDG